MSKFKEQRVGVLVDVQNMYYSARVLFSKKTNFGEILKEAISERKAIRAIAYGIATEEKTEDKFFDSLEKHGFEVKTKDLQIFKGGSKKGDWDVGITIDAIKLAKNLDVIVLVSGDGDYIPLVKYLQYNFGVRVEAMAFEESCSAQLIDEVDAFTNLSSDDKFLVAEKGNGKLARRKPPIRKPSPVIAKKTSSTPPRPQAKVSHRRTTRML